MLSVTRYDKDAAFANIELLEKIVLFKEKFYRCPWAKYEDAKIGTMKLMPPERNLQALKDDYDHMQNMIFGEKTIEEQNNVKPQGRLKNKTP